MAKSPEQIQEEVAQHVRNLWGENPVCPMCRDPGHDWEIGLPVIAPTWPPAFSFASQFIPFIPVTCANCLYTVFVHGLSPGKNRKAGLMPKTSDGT